MGVGHRLSTPFYFNQTLAYGHDKEWGFLPSNRWDP